MSTPSEKEQNEITMVIARLVPYILQNESMSQAVQEALTHQRNFKSLNDSVVEKVVERAFLRLTEVESEDDTE